MLREKPAQNVRPYHHPGALENGTTVIKDLLESGRRRSDVGAVSEVDRGAGNLAMRLEATVGLCRVERSPTERIATAAPGGTRRWSTT